MTRTRRTKARESVPAAERMRQSRERARAAGIQRVEIAVTVEVLAEIDRRADELLTSRGEIVAMAINQTNK